MSDKVFGFTLAEVLITLGVIGVVSAMTMPSLIQNYQKQASVNQLKKAYSEMSQAIQKSEAEFGTLEQWHIPVTDFSNRTEQYKYFGEKYLFPHIKTVERCIPTSNKCWAEPLYNLANAEVKGIYPTNNNPDAISFVTASGYSVFYWLHDAGGGMWYIIDINGPKKGPNKIGRDVFAFIVNWGTSWGKTGYYPAGLNYNPTPTKEELISGDVDSGYLKCDKTAVSNQAIGLYCTGVIALDGWKIDKNYPW